MGQTMENMFKLNLKKLHLQDGKMLSAKESKLTYLLMTTRTPVLIALSKTSTSQTKHSFLHDKKQKQLSTKSSIDGNQGLKKT